MTDTPPPYVEGVSPALAHMGIEMTGWSAEVARFEADITPFMANRSGIPHGGIYAMMLDTAMGYSGAFTGDAESKIMTLTLSLNVNYLSRPKGIRLIAEGRKTGGGARTFFSDGRLFDETGEMIATAQGTFRVRGDR